MNFINFASVTRLSRIASVLGLSLVLGCVDLVESTNSSNSKGSLANEPKLSIQDSTNVGVIAHPVPKLTGPVINGDTAKTHPSSPSIIGGFTDAEKRKLTENGPDSNGQVVINPPKITGPVVGSADSVLILKNGQVVINPPKSSGPVIGSADSVLILNP